MMSADMNLPTYQHSNKHQKKNKVKECESMNKKIDVKTTEKKKATIEIAEHPTFEGDMKTNITSSVEVADIVSSLFAPAFSDYYGCKININDGHGMPAVVNSMPYGAIYVDLYFKDQGQASSGIKNIKPIGAKEEDGRTDLGARFMKVNGAFTNGRTYKVTEETYECLEDFMRSGNKTRWYEHTQEIESNMSIYGKNEVVVCISGIDLNRVITAIYGKNTEEGIYEYIATPSTIIPGKNQEFIMQICQLDLSAVRKLQQSLGIYGANAPQFHAYNGNKK